MDRIQRCWLAAQSFEQVNTELAFIDNLAACDGLAARKQALDERLSRVARDPEFWPLVSRLHALSADHRARGRRLPAVRPRRAARLLAGAGALPSAVRRIRHARVDHQDRLQVRRRILVEAAWHYTRPPRIGRTLAERHDGLPDHILQIAWRAQHRLHRIHRRMRERKKPGNVITVAWPRELSCFLWAAATAP